MRMRAIFAGCLILIAGGLSAAIVAGWVHGGGQGAPALIRSVKSGPWSDGTTWQGGNIPNEFSRVQIKAGHTVTYDLKAGAVIRSIDVAGTLTFAHDRDTRLDVGLIKIQPGDDASEDGFDCDGHAPEVGFGEVRPALEIGMPDQPLDAKFKAIIRLTPVAGLDKKSCPALVCCGGRLDLHGAPLNRTWVKLGATAGKGVKEVTLAEAVSGWRVGDKVIITATQGQLTTEGTRRPGVADVDVQTEERIITAMGDTTITLDRPLAHQHWGLGEYRGAVANLSRNVVVESADPRGQRGHTMFHRGSAGAISYAEFRHLGKEGVLGRYALHYHLCGNSMRGSYVLGASIWDSHNRWLTIHGTNYVVVRDCVGYQSVGHGFFLEDGTEVFNVFDRNLAVQAFHGKPLPGQILPFDGNEGAGFWWANSLNTFTNNATCENDRYGFRFEATAGSNFRPVLRVQEADGQRRGVDIRTLPFVRFDGNEACCDGKYGFNLGEGVQRIGPDFAHPFVVRNLKIWQVNYAFRPQSPSLLVENLKIHQCNYGVYHPNYDHHVYKNLHISETNSEPFNRGHDDDSIQFGPLTVEGLTFEGLRNNDIPMIQISDDNPTGKAESHFKDVKVLRRLDKNQRALVDLGGGERRPPTTVADVPVFLHDYFGPGRHARVVSIHAAVLRNSGAAYRQEPPLTGKDSRVAEVKDVTFPILLKPVDDLPPITVITQVTQPARGVLKMRGTTSDNGEVVKVIVNGQQAKALRPNFAEWEVELTGLAAGDLRLEARAEDAAGNVEAMPHRRMMTVR